jgi:hypothetical protein
MAPDVDEVFRLEERRKAKELTDEGMRRTLFYSALVGWRKIGSDKSFSFGEKLEALFGDPEIREFVLTQSAELLGEEFLKLQAICGILERRILESRKVGIS